MADNIKVVIKVRPLIKREIDDNLQKQWTVSENTIFPFEQSGRDGIGSFTFDHVFDDTSLTQDVYEKVARPIVEAAVEGMNGTIFAYGQTSSGKTYTMMGDAASPGVIPLAISNIFQTIESKIDRDFLLRVSYIEIYNERIRDLLDVSNVDLKIHEDFNGQVIVKCKEEVTSKPNQVLELMKKGDRNRSTGETQMNERSSRSHTIFIIIIESRRHVSPGEEEENCVNVSQLNLVDLAGSERAGQTGATRLRLREGGHINKSLSTLGNVIRQLSDAQGDTSRFINFRDSKLTRILQTSLGGNAKTGIICAVTPAVLDETYSTLTFAMCAKAIENKPKVNAVMSDATQIKRLTKEMRNLQEELESKKHLEVDNKRLQEQLAILRDKILMGNSEEGSVQRAAALRRRTWCAPQRSGLPPILEHQPQPDFLWEKNKFKPGNNIQRLSNVTERDDDSTVGSRDSITSGRGADTPVSWKNMAMGDVICLDDSEKVVNSPCNSPNHKCFGIHHTPPCVLRFRSHIAEKERKEIEELTTLENMYAPEKVELIQHIALLRSRQEEILSQKQATDKEYEKIQKEIALLQESLDKISKDLDEANILRKKSEEEAKSLKCINTDLEFQIENLQIRTQNREKELVNCLKEAREEKERSQITQRRSSIPQFLNMSQDISLLANSDIESVHELSVENDTVKLKNVLSQKDLDMAEKDNCISELRERLKCITLEKESIQSEHNAKLILIDSMEMQCIQKCEQTKLYSELKTKYDNLIKELDKSNCKLLELTEENKSIFTYVNQIAELKDQMEKMAAQRESYLSMDGQKQSDRLNQLECLITNMQNEMTNYQQQLSERDLEISSKESELKSIIENNKTISDDLLKVKESLFRTEAEKIKLINDVNVKNSQIEMLTKDIAEDNLQCSTVPQMNEELKKNLENFTRDMNDKNALVENLQQTLAELEYKLHSNEESQKHLNEMNIKLTKGISEINLQYSNVSQNNEELKKNLENVTRDLNDKNGLVENLQHTLVELKNKLQTNEEFQRCLSEMNEKLTKDISDSNLQYSTVSQINEELKKNLENVTRDLNDKNALVENLQHTLVELENKLQKNEELQRRLSELNEKLTKDISESNLQYSTISQINEELKKNLENITRDLNDKNVRVENLQHILVELENKLQKIEELQRRLSEINEKLTKDISESNLQYSTISQINEELKKNLENATRDLNDKNALVENLQQSVIQLECKLQQNEESLNCLNQMNGQIESEKLYLETFLNEKCTEIMELIEQTDTLRDNVKTMQSTIELKSQFLTGNDEEIHILKNKNNNYLILIEELKRASSKYDFVIQEKEHLIAELNSRILCLESDVDRVTESWEKSSQKMDDLQYQLKQALSHNLKGTFERLLSEISTVTTYLLEDEFFKSIVTTTEQEVDVTKNNIHLDIVQSENKDVINLCRALLLFKINITSFKTNFDNLNHLQTNMQYYESEIEKLKNIIETQNRDLIKSKINKKEYEDLQYLFKDPYNDKENVKKSGATLTPLKKKKEDFIPSDSQLYLSPYSPLKLETLKESVNLGKSPQATSPMKNKLDVKKVLELILNEINSNKESYKPINTSVLNIPELKFILEKLKELKMALTASVESNNLLQEKVLKLENINNELRTILKSTHLKMSNIDKIHSDIYNDSDVIFSGGTSNQYFDVFKHSIHDILSLKSVIQQSLTCVESENIYDDQSAIVVKSKQEDVDMDPAHDESWTYSSVEESKQITFDLDKLDMFISLFETNMFEAYSLLEVCENDFSNSDETYKCGYNLESKLSKITCMHRFLIEKLKKLILSKNHDYEELFKQNILLKNDMERCEKEVRELVSDTEELEKRVLHQRSETEVGYAEYSLLNSQYTTVQHHHSNLHSSCISTASYLREQLTHLQLTLLQTEKVNNENHLSFDFSTPKKCPPSDAVSNLVINNESIKTPVNLIPEIPSTEVDNTQYENLKIECEKLRSDVSAKCSEIRLLSDQLADHESLKRHYSQLQNEHDTLSTELMDCLQETDEIKKLYNSLKAELETVKYNDNSKTTVNTSLQTDKVNMLDTSIQTSTCAANLESRETNTSVVVENVYDAIGIECEEFIKKYIYSMNEVIPDAQCTLLELLKLYVSVMEKRLSSLSYELTSMEDSNKCLQSDIIAKQNLLDEYQNNKILSLQEELLCKSSEISTLQSEVLKHKEDLTNTLNMVQHLQDTNKLLKNEIEQQNNSSKALIKVHETEINKLETKEKDILNEYSEKEKDFINIIGSLKNELNDRVSEISHLQNEVKNKDNILNSLNEKYDNMCKTMSDVNFDSDKHKIELSALQLEISDTLGEKFKLKEEIHNSLQTIEQLKEELLTKSNQLATVQKNNDALTDKGTILSQSLDNINKNYAHLQNKFQDQEKALKEMLDLKNVISELESQITTNKEEKRRLSNDVKMLENEIQTLKLHIKQYDEELKTSEDQIKNLLQNNIILKQSEEELSKTKEDAIKNLRNESEATIKQLKDNIVILNEQLKCKKNALDAHEIKFSDLSKSFKEKENLLEVISNKYEDDKKKHALQVASLEEKLHKLNTDKILIEEERFSLLSNNDQMSCLLNDKDLEIESKADKIRKLEVMSRASTSLQFENQRLQTELQNQTDCVKGLQSKIKCLLETRSEESYSAQRLQELKVEHSRLSSTNHILENRVADLQAELSALLKSSPKMRHDLHLRRQSLHDLQRSLVQHGDNVKTSTEDNDVSMEDCSMSRENSELKEKVKQLDLQLKAVKNRYTQLEQAHSDMTEEHQKIVSRYNIMEAKLKELHTIDGTRKPKQDASTNTNPDDKGALMALFVDKMTYDFLNEKYKNLQKANEDYRMKNKEQTVELRRLQHSLQNNTLHTLLPRDESKNIIELQTQLKTLEQEIKLLREREKEQTDWETKYKEMDAEYDVCIDQLKETNSSYNLLCSEKLLMEVELQNLKSELETAKRGSPGREIRRKRQSIYDANRGTSFTTADASTNTTGDYPNQLSFTCINCESTRQNLEEMKIRHAELETRLNLRSAVVPIVLSPAHCLPGTGVVQAQKLHEYMAENQMLKLKLSKYKEYYHHRKTQQKQTQDNQNNK